MAEKEERILVLKATEDDFIYKHFNGKGFIPRSYAIERMEKAMKQYAKDEEIYTDKDLAIVVLNALLEGK